MAEVSYLSKEQVDESLRPTFEGIEKKTGAVGNMLRALAHSPDLFQAFLTLNGALGKMKLAPKLRELAYLKASTVNGCEYCLHYHRLGGRKAGVSNEQIEAVSHTEPGSDFDELEWDVIRFAEQVTQRVKPDDALMHRLKTKLSDREIVELTMTVAVANLTNRVNETLKTELP
jgi:uncharacterized peroxidase-related enzyme